MARRKKAAARPRKAARTRVSRETSTPPPETVAASNIGVDTAAAAVATEPLPEATASSSELPTKHSDKAPSGTPTVPAAGNEH